VVVDLVLGGQQVLALSQILWALERHFEALDGTSRVRSIECSLSNPKVRQYPLARDQPFSTLPGVEAPGLEYAKRLFVTPEQVQEGYVLGGEVVALVTSR